MIFLWWVCPACVKRKEPINGDYSFIGSASKASGSLMTVTCKFFTSIKVFCLHLGQNSGEFFRSASFLILVRFLLSKTGQYIYLVLKSITIFLLQVSILHIVHFVGPDLSKLRHREHYHIRILMLAAILLRCVVLILE